MARIKDRWWKTVSGKKVKSAEYDTGKRWQVQWTDDEGKDCKRNFELKAGKNPELHAEAFRTQVEADLLKGTYVSPEDANVTFKEYSRQWLETHKTGDVNTDARRERQLRLHVWEVIGGRTLRELSKRPSIIQSWIQGLGGKATSKRLIIRDVSPIFATAVDDELIHRNPFKVKSVKIPKLDPYKAEPWPLAWVERMSEELPGFWAVLPYLGAGSGMRQGEMFGLSIDDIDFFGRKITVNCQLKRVGTKWVFAQLKNRKPHEVPIADSLCKRLREHIRTYPPVEVTLPWETLDGKPMTRKLIIVQPNGQHMRAERFSDDFWRPARQRVGIPDERRHGMHVLRHTFVSVLLSHGVDIVKVANYIGDTVSTVAENYAHFIPGRDDQLRDSIDAFFRDGDVEEAEPGLEEDQAGVIELKTKIKN